MKHRPDGIENALWPLAALIFVQMLPATLVVPAIRPLFAALHAGNEHAMHAFMAVNMVGAAISAPLFGKYAARLGNRQRVIGLLCSADALLLVLVSLRLPTALVLVLRTFEGAAHVGAASLLLSQAAALGRKHGNAHSMGVAGGAIMLAVAAGSALGGQIVGFDPRAPFWLGATLALGVAARSLFGPRATTLVVARSGVSGPRALDLLARGRRLWVPLGAAFVGRFTVGCVVVTFALFAHRAHKLDDRSIGMLFTLLTLPFAVLVYPLARLGDRLPRAALFGGGAACYAAALLLLGNVATSTLPLVMAAAGAASAMIFAGVLCYAASEAKGHHDRAMALVNGAGCLGMVLGPAAAGITSAVVGSSGDPVRGYRAVFILAAGSVLLWLVASLPWLATRWREERRGSALDEPTAQSEA